MVNPNDTIKTSCSDSTSFLNNSPNFSQQHVKNPCMLPTKEEHKSGKTKNERDYQVV